MDEISERFNRLVEWAFNPKNHNIVDDYTKQELYDALAEFVYAYHLMIDGDYYYIPGYKVKADYFGIKLPEKQS